MYRSSFLRCVAARMLSSAFMIAALPLQNAAIAQTAPAPATPQAFPAAPGGAGQNAPPAEKVLPAIIVRAPQQKKPTTRPTKKPPSALASRPAHTRTARMTKPSPTRPTTPPLPNTTPALAGGGTNAPPLFSRWSATAPDGKPAFVERYQLPNTLASVTRKYIEEKINIVDSSDAVKYLPSLFVRKRNDGDTQAVLATRTWGVNSSARSLVYADDVLLSALIGNDNTIGAPRWGLVAPNEIERVDFLYGPFSAAYAGNSMGGVLQITTRMPEKLEATFEQKESIQTFNQNRTSQTYPTSITSASIGDKLNDFSWFAAANFMDNHTQPLTYVTTPNIYPWPGAVWATNKYGTGPANVLGALGQLNQQQVNAKLKLAYDITPSVRAAYQLGFWSNDSRTTPENYLANGGSDFFGPATGRAAIGAQALQSFGAGYYRIQEQMLTNSGSLKSNTGGIFDFELSASNFSYLKSDQISPYSALAPMGYTPNGKVARLGGTYWNLYDAKGIWRPTDKHDVSFGFHADEFHLNNPTWLTANWTSGAESAVTQAPASIAQGTTRTQALWAQDAWKFHPDFKLTLGMRWENWTASDGYNQSLNSNLISANGLLLNSKAPASLASSLPIYQPGLHHQRFSPKGSLQWKPDDIWTLTGNIGMANRFPTVRELYNLSVLSNASGIIANPNPNLAPEVALTSEIAIERKISADGNIRLSLFNEEVRDAIIAQNINVAGSTVPISTTANINKIRNRGVEIALRKDNFLIDRLEVTASATAVDSRILDDRNWAGGSAATFDTWNASPVGKNVPYVPKWRWTLTSTYRPDDHWSFTAAARWQGRMWSTLSNNDIAHGVYQAFDRFFVVDAKIRYKMNERASFDFGVDNIGNYKYYLFHPFPQRTYTLAGKYQFGAVGRDDVGIFRQGADEDFFDSISRVFTRL